jgi:hypothetical protein
MSEPTSIVAAEGVPIDSAILEQVVVQNDLAKLAPGQRLEYYSTLCRSLGLNPLTRPFQYITLNSKLTLYATRDATDQLRKGGNISIQIVAREKIDDIYVVTARAIDTRTGRQDESTGAVAISGLRGEALANAMMKAETKAKRRVTLCICGLGMSDESEVMTIPGAVVVDVDAATGEIVQPASPRDPKEEATSWWRARGGTVDQWNQMKGRGAQIPGLVREAIEAGCSAPAEVLAYVLDGVVPAVVAEEDDGQGKASPGPGADPATAAAATPASANLFDRPGGEDAVPADPLAGYKVFYRQRKELEDLAEKRGVDLAAEAAACPEKTFAGLKARIEAVAA